MPFTVRFPTRHTDTYAATGFVHAGVLLALTELAYAAYERAAGLSKPAHIVSVQVRTRAEYRVPLPWQDGAVVEVTTLAASSSGFSQRFTVRSGQTDRLVATLEHDWVWLDTTSGRAVPLPPDVQARVLAAPDTGQSNQLVQ
jgi:acyl-CoA thioesterase FadM